MRRDRVGIHGGTASTPHFDAFARGNLLFEKAASQAPWTKPSIATLFTSLYPSQHGVVKQPRDMEKGDGPAVLSDLVTEVLSHDFVTLAETLSSSGFQTAALVGNPWMAKPFGFSQGFSRYDDSFASWAVPGEVISQAALEWLGQIQTEDRFFLYLHYMDSHRPYPPLDTAEIRRQADRLRSDTRPLPQGMRKNLPRPLQQVLASMGIEPSLGLVDMNYDSGVEAFDQALGQLLQGFSSHPAFEHTAIVVTSDHGEALYARGYGNHGRGLYEDEVSIPLAMRLPGVSTEDFRDNRLVGLIDLMPTLLDYLGIEIPGMAQGQSLFQPTSSERCLVTEGVANKPTHRAIRLQDYKLLWQPEGGPGGRTKALFHLEMDGDETRNLLTGKQQTQAQAIFADLQKRGATEVIPFNVTPGASVPLDPDIAEQLRAIGYLEDRQR